MLDEKENVIYTNHQTCSELYSFTDTGTLKEYRFCISSIDNDTSLIRFFSIIDDTIIDVPESCVLINSLGDYVSYDAESLMRKFIQFKHYTAYILYFGSVQAIRIRAILFPKKYDDTFSSVYLSAIIVEGRKYFEVEDLKQGIISVVSVAKVLHTSEGEHVSLYQFKGNSMLKSFIFAVEHFEGLTSRIIFIADGNDGKPRGTQVDVEPRGTELDVDPLFTLVSLDLFPYSRAGTKNNNSYIYFTRGENYTLFYNGHPFIDIRLASDIMLSQKVYFKLIDRTDGLIEQLKQI